LMEDEDILQITIGGHPVGILGFKAVIEELGSALVQSPDALLGRELVARLSQKNYIPEKVQAEYGNALAREFRRQLGQPVPEEKTAGIVIKVLGQGCNNCRELTQRIMDVMSELGLAADLEHVTDIKAIARYGVLGNPALLINGKVLSVGTVPNKKQLVEWLKQAGA
jgi:small redox-active disulfide protein 2